MTTVEELQGMTHEDLVRRIQELQEANEKLTKERDSWYESWSKLSRQYDNFKNTIKGIVLIVD